jgi:hypothetical protein
MILFKNTLLANKITEHFKLFFFKKKKKNSNVKETIIEFHLSLENHFVNGSVATWMFSISS